MAEISSEITKQAKVLWDFNKIDNVLAKSDLILCLGGNDVRNAERAAEIYLQGYAPLILFSGGFGNITKNIWHEPEAEKFTEIAINKGVAKKNILIENKSTNTGENIRFSYNLLQEKNIQPQSIILVHEASMGQRTYATFMAQWPEPKPTILVTSPQISFEDFANQDISLEHQIQKLVGDTKRVIEYPAKGFQIFIEVPEIVKKAYNYLSYKGFTYDY